MNKLRSNIFVNLLLAISMTLVYLPSYAKKAKTKPKPTAWSYDAGPLKGTSLGDELIQITNEIPNFAAMSKEMIDEFRFNRKKPAAPASIRAAQKFRPAFGPIPWRMPQAPNSVKMLFIGQDGTHIAEAAARPATAGFGGRAQDLANYFGVDYSAAFINTYAFTIKGQYGAYQTPYLYKNGDKKSIRFSGYVDNDLWLLTHDKYSPLANWRNRLIDWIIRNNRDSLELIVLFGGSARDSIASFIESKGGKVGTRLSNSAQKKIQVPLIRETRAGGNNVWPVPLNKDGGDLYVQLNGGKKINYTKPEGQKAAMALLKNNAEEAAKQMVFTGGGETGTGMIHPAQLGGYDLKKMEIAGERTVSIAKLKLSDGKKAKTNGKELLVVQLPHPSALSRLTKPKASDAVKKALKQFKSYKDKGWKITADHGQKNMYDAGEDFNYGRGQIGPEYYDFGTPRSRMVSVSSAKRMSGNPNVIIFGTRDNGEFNKTKVKKMTAVKSVPSGINSKDLYIARPRTGTNATVFDKGPGAAMAKVFKESLLLENGKNYEEAFKKTIKGHYTYGSKTFKKDGIAAYSVKTEPYQIGDFGHYRGDFKGKALIIADPAGHDDMITARALTGDRGQKLQGMMEDFGFKDDYLVVKTVPFGMEGASDADWSKTLGNLKKYHKAVFGKIKADREKNKFEVVFADGDHAAKIAKEHFKGYKIVNLDRTKSLKGIKYKSKTAKGSRAIIPRSHMSYYARVWEGTSGNRVIGSDGKKYKGLAYATVAPEWAYKQKWSVSNSMVLKDGMKTIDGGVSYKDAVEMMNDTLVDSELRRAGQSVANLREELGEDIVGRNVFSPALGLLAELDWDVEEFIPTLTENLADEIEMLKGFQGKVKSAASSMNAVVSDFALITEEVIEGLASSVLSDFESFERAMMHYDSSLGEEEADDLELAPDEL